MNLTTIFVLMHRTSTYHVITVVWTFIMLTLWAKDFRLTHWYLPYVSILSQAPTTQLWLQWKWMLECRLIQALLFMTVQPQTKYNGGLNLIRLMLQELQCIHPVACRLWKGLYHSLQLSIEGMWQNGRRWIVHTHTHTHTHTLLPLLLI